MKEALRILLLVLALAGFLVFLSFNIEQTGPRTTVTVGLNLSPWFRLARVDLLGTRTQKTEVNILSWSAAGLVAGVVFLGLRARVK